MKNISLKSLEKIILDRSFDWFIVSSSNENKYLISYVCSWSLKTMNYITVMVNAIFLDQMVCNILVVGWIKCTERNYQMRYSIFVNVFVNLILVKVNSQLFYHYICVTMVKIVYYRIDFDVFLLDPNAENEEIIQMLRSCYLYALYVELCQNRGEIEGKRMCSKILQVRFNKWLFRFIL